ncbi:MAG: hypothetical protein ABI241_00710 [Bacteroidia bacterium]
MILYEEIIFLETYFDGKYCVENVIPFYEPLIHAQKRGRHLYWTNFILPTDLGERSAGKGLIANNSPTEVKDLCNFHLIDLTTYKGDQQKNKIARNLVDFEVGKTILDTAMGIISKSNVKQHDLFEY